MRIITNVHRNPHRGLRQHTILTIKDTESREAAYQVEMYMSPAGGTWTLHWVNMNKEMDAQDLTEALNLALNAY